MIENDLRDPQIYDEFMEYAELKIKRKCKNLNQNEIINLVHRELGYIHRYLNHAFDFVEDNPKEKTAETLNSLTMHYEYAQFLIENYTNKNK